jgi:hypothetical protein
VYRGFKTVGVRGGALADRRASRPLQHAVKKEDAMTKLIGSAVVSLCLAASVAIAGPGDPFGGDDTGCAPADNAGYVCGSAVAKALGKLGASVIKCHVVQAGQAFKTNHSSPGFDNAEENCEEGPSNTSAKAKFDAVLAKYATSCDPAVIASAQARRDVVLADQSNPDSLDALNGSFFCDNSSGMTIAEPGGDDAGFIPADANAYKCSVAVAKASSKLLVAAYKCHWKAAQAAFRNKAFDEDACEDGAPPLRSALAKYNAQVQRYVALGICPSCLSSAAAGLGTDAVADLDAQNAEIFPCPTPPTAPPCNDLGGGQCSDVCANAGDECLFVPTGFELVGVPGYPDIHGSDDCRCVPSSLRCENLAASVCATSGSDGLCPTAAEQCVNGGSACSCQ